MRKKIIALSLVLVISTGIGLGVKYYKQNESVLTKSESTIWTTKKQESDKTKSQGDVLDVKPNQITVKTSGKTITYTTDKNTIIQEGTTLLCNPDGKGNREVDLTACLKSGMNVNISAQGDKVYNGKRC
ncbi:hypothetical protein Dred_0814 [Desulforamulus reducens MI-1]|uniref:DUF5666 domain-containing protein n=1 Tax=Desulforamulus reducens (strain ATCC BAA-1160 / DSM 100696 / MI-1) TaxID=349161 RepID=A4J2P9_DESRM|nr:hypothetical protein [Desulforamulus reducens]ABO49352.1 hypothetical protein Dred_0814 [Desulforamulus reducens MI-1]